MARVVIMKMNWRLRNWMKVKETESQETMTASTG